MHYSSIVRTANTDLRLSVDLLLVIGPFKGGKINMSHKLCFTNRNWFKLNPAGYIVQQE